MKPIQLLALGAVLLVVLGCGKDGNNNGNPVLSREGSWMTSCFGKGTDSGSDMLVFAGSAWTWTSRSFIGKNCAAGFLDAKVTGTFVEGAASTRVAGAREVDEIVARVEIIVRDDLWSQFLSEQKFCGFDDWKTEVPKDVTGRTCGETLILKSGTRRYNLYQVKTDGSLVTGKLVAPYDGGSPETRARQLDTIRVFRKAPTKTKS